MYECRCYSYASEEEYHTHREEMEKDGWELERPGAFSTRPGEVCAWVYVKDL